MFNQYLNISSSNFQQDLLQVKNYMVSITKDFICYDKIYPFLTKGKLLRSILSLKITYKYTNKLPDDIYKFLAIVELIHISSLLHDDVIDNSSLRRSLPTINKLYGNKIGILIGDYIIVRICKLLSNSDLLVEFIDTCHRMVAGAYLEQQLQLTDDLDLYINETSNKTGSLFELAGFVGTHLLNLNNICIPMISNNIDKNNFPHIKSDPNNSKMINVGSSIGANIVSNKGNNSSVNSKENNSIVNINSTKKFCLYYGIIFQIQDDLNDYNCDCWNDSEDYAQSRITFPIMLLQNKEWFINKSQSNFNKIKKFIQSASFTELAYEKLNKYISFIKEYALYLK